MSTTKWGESFLKSGLPLEHLTIVTLQASGWACTPHVEYERQASESGNTWFEIDLLASKHIEQKAIELILLTECKYHDESRFWFFLPYTSEGRWRFNDRILNCAPFAALVSPRSDSLFALAEASTWGIVVSKDGVKQENAVRKGTEQLSNAFLPYLLGSSFGYDLDRTEYVPVVARDPQFVPSISCVVPMLVTNARIFRLKPNVTDLDTIRKASEPTDIADEVEWTWCYHDPPLQQVIERMNLIQAHQASDAEQISQFPGVSERIEEFDTRPNWIAVVNIKHLESVAGSIFNAVGRLPFRSLRNVLYPRAQRSVRKLAKALGKRARG